MLADHAELGSLDPAALQGLLDASAARATTSYTIHPGVAETERVGRPTRPCSPRPRSSWGTTTSPCTSRALKVEIEGGGSGVAESARRAVRPTCCARDAGIRRPSLLDRMIQRDQSPDSLAFALPLLRRIVEATAGTERELSDAGILARTLRLAGRTAEAEPMLRDVSCVPPPRATTGWRRASPAICATCSEEVGRLEDALKVAVEKADYTRQAGLGPCTELADEGRRLQVLADMGRMTRRWTRWSASPLRWRGCP